MRETAHGQGSFHNSQRSKSVANNLLAKDQNSQSRAYFDEPQTSLISNHESAEIETEKRPQKQRGSDIRGGDKNLLYEQAITHQGRKFTCTIEKIENGGIQVTVTDCDSQKIWKCQQTALEYTEETEDLNFDSNKFLVCKINLLVFEIENSNRQPKGESGDEKGDGGKGVGVGGKEGVGESLGEEVVEVVEVVEEVEEVVKGGSGKKEMLGVDSGVYDEEFLKSSNGGGGGVVENDGEKVEKEVEGEVKEEEIKEGVEEVEDIN